MKRPFFAVLGGMGTLATESYIRLVNAATHAHSDQDTWTMWCSTTHPFPTVPRSSSASRMTTFPRHRRRYREGNGDGREFHCAHLQYRALFL